MLSGERAAGKDERIMIGIEELISRQDKPEMELSLENKVYRGYTLRCLLKEYRDWHTAEISGRDGCIIAMSREEIQSGKVWLVRQDSWRLVISGDKYHRRWCRNVYQIELNKGEPF